jgi:putative ABC transport system permease protein
LNTLMMDLRHAVRMLVKSPGFTLAAVLCLTLGIGATTAIFSVVNAVLLRPLGYRNPEQLVRVYTEFPAFPNGGLRRFWTSPPEFLDLRRDTQSWKSLDAWANAGANIAGVSQPARVTASFVSGGLMQSLGVLPKMGRTLAPADDDPAAPLTADISYGLWKSAFGGDPLIVGKQTYLSGKKCTIVGVMPRGFEFPPGEIDPPQVWSPLQIDAAKPGSRGSHYLYLLGRLKPGVTPPQAQSELVAYERSVGEQHKSANEHYFNVQNHTLVSFPLQTEVVGNARQALLMLLAAVCFVLLIACVNVANLLLARAEARRREIAIRSALGAGTGRLARQFVTEGLVLSACGAVLGLGLAFGGLRMIQLTNAGSLPRASEIGIDLRVLLFTVLATVLTGVLFGLAPIFSVVVKNLQDSLKDTIGSATSNVGAQSFRRILVAGELAMALVLLIGCGLMVRGFWKLQQVSTGLNPTNVVTMQISLPGSTYPKPEQSDQFWKRLDEKIAQIPGVQSGGIAYGLPPMRPPNMNDTHIEGFVQRQGGPIESVDYYNMVTKDFFKTLGVRLTDGRVFDERDVQGSPDVVIVNQTMARTFWGNENPIGHRLQPGMSGPWCTIIGVVEDVKNAGLDKPTGTEIFLPLGQKQAEGVSSASVFLRAQGDSSSLANTVRSEVRSLDPSVPVARVQTMEQVLATAQSRPRFLTLLLTLFSAVALMIATVGIYGVISFSVAQRSKEFGLRMALGAQHKDVIGLVMKQGALLTLLGVAVGVCAAFALTRLMASLLFGVGPTDTLTFISVPLLLAVVALCASFIPAQRASKVSPMEALRHE